MYTPTLYILLLLHYYCAAADDGKNSVAVHLNGKRRFSTHTHTHTTRH